MDNTPVNETVASSVPDVRDAPLDSLAADLNSRLATLTRATGRAVRSEIPVAAFNSAI